jgi:hypothetical protein
MTVVPLRLSILTMYYRLSPVKAFRWAVITVGAVQLVHGLIGLLLIFFSCRPVNKYWDVTITSGFCIDRSKFSIAYGYSNIVYDFILVVLPLPTIWGLHLPIRQKIAVSGIFMAGFA